MLSRPTLRRAALATAMVVASALPCRAADLPVGGPWPAEVRAGSSWTADPGWGVVDAPAGRPARVTNRTPGYAGSDYGLGKPSYSGIGPRPDWGRSSE